MAEVPSFDKLFIGGEWVEPATSDRFEVVSPFTEEVIASTPAASPTDVDRAVAAARTAFDEGPWPRMSAAERADAMQRLLDLIYENANDLAELITAEVGAPLLFSHLGQVGATGMVLDYFVGLTRTYEFEEVRQGFMGPALVRKEPVGVAAGIIPWNVPLFITMLKLGPTLASGSTIVIKPAPETPVSALVLARARRAGRHPGRRLQRGARRPRVGRDPRDPSWRRQGELHRFDERRPSHRCALRPAAEALHPRARREVRRDHPRRRRRGVARARAAAERDHEQRSGVRGTDPHPGVEGEVRGGRRRVHAGHVRARGRGPGRDGVRRRTADRRAPARPRRGLHRQGSRGRRRASRSAAAVPPASTMAGSWSRRCSPTSTTR